MMASLPLYANFAELSLSETPCSREDRASTPDDQELGCTFVSPPARDLICHLCGLVLRDPHQAQCCGNHYCKYCLTLQLNEKSECAFCFSRQVRAFRDVSVTRRINQLKIKCPHRDRGCKWSGELTDAGNHFVKCVGKPSVCRTCAGVFPRDRISEHEKTLCPRRIFQCPYCKLYKSTYEVVKTVHWPKCLHFPILCPNGCTDSSIPRKDVLRHLRSECQVKRKLTELSAVVEQLKSQLKERDAEIEELQSKVSAVSEESKLLSLGEDNAKLVERITDIQKERSELEHDKICLEQDLRAKNSRIQGLESQNGNLRNSLQHMEHDLSTQLQAMKVLCETLRDEKESLERRLMTFTNGGISSNHDKSASQ